MYERLTEWNEEYGCWSYKCASGDAAKRLAAYEDSGLSPDEIQELAKAKAEGRLVVLLPIDTGVFIVQDGEILGFRIYEYSLFSTNNLNIRYWSECITDDDEDDLDFWADDIGVAVFLTREAAEKAITEVVGE